MPTSTITPAQRESIRDYVTTHTLPAGLGSKEAACSVAAINLALTGELTDKIPGCMSVVVGKWIIRIQDAVPADVRNSAEWKELLPFAAGTGRDKEGVRRDMVRGWMWGVLELLQPVADKGGYGKEWSAMTEAKTAAAAASAASAADAYAYASAADAYAYAYAADAYAAYASRAADASAADAAAYAAATYAADDAYAYAAADAASASRVAYAYAADAYAAAVVGFWKHADPAGLLKRLIEA